MMKYVVAYLGAAGTFLIVDLVWLGLVAKSFYRDRIGSLMLDEINLPPAILFYGLYVAGIVIFAITPALHTGSWRTALLFGATFGLIAYATYDLTNLATLRNWSVAMTVVDIAWGSFLTGVSATAGFMITRYVFPASSGS